MAGKCRKQPLETASLFLLGWLLLAESRQFRRQLARRIPAIHLGQRKLWLLELMCGCGQLWIGIAGRVSNGTNGRVSEWNGWQVWVESALQDATSQ
jgi:hypothetical protein